MIVFRRVIFVPVIVLFIASLTALLGLTVSEQIYVTIEGRVVNMTRDGTVNTRLEIFLHIIDEQSQIDLRKVHSETDGSFRFEKVSYVAQLRYVVSAVYEGVIYSRDVKFVNDKNSLPEPMELVVYHSTHSQETLKILDSVFLVTGADQDSEVVRVFERLTLLNNGDRTYVPDLNEPQKMNFLRFSLPVGTTDLDVRTELKGGRVITVDKGFALTVSVAPGEHQIGFSYNSPYKKGSLSLIRSFPWSAEIFRVLIPNSIGTLDGVGFEKVGPVNIGGVAYDLEEIRDVPYGEDVEIRIRHLPQDLLWKRTWRHFDTIGYIKLIAPVLVGLVLVGLLTKGLLKRHSTVKGDDVLDKESLVNYARERESLISTIAKLDINYEKGQIKESEYYLQRKELKDRLLQVVLWMSKKDYGIAVSDDNCSREVDR